MRILVTGANGQLGMTFRAIAPKHPEHEFFFCTSKELDVTDPNSVEAVIQNYTPEVVINCAAYTAVDRAEEEPEKAYAVNADGVKNLVDACQKISAALIHFSTDYVFDGRKNKPYTEIDEPNPINIYGKSKLAGEKHVLSSDLKATVIRTSWVYSEFGNNFVQTMLRLGRERKSLNVVNDQFGSPTYARDLAVASLIVAQYSKRFISPPSLYHFSNDGVISWFDFASEIMILAKSKCEICPISSNLFPQLAERPSFSVLKKSKFIEDFNLKTTNWKESLMKMIKDGILD